MSTDQGSIQTTTNPIAVVLVRLCLALASSLGVTALSSGSGTVALARSLIRGLPNPPLRQRRMSGRPTSKGGRTILVFGICLTALGASGASAADGDLRASYAVSFAGLPLANATLYVALRGSTYTARVDYRVYGAMRLLSDATGAASSSGTHKGGRFVPTGFDLDHRSGSRRQKVKLNIADGAVKTMLVDPPAVLDSNQTPIEPKHLSAIVDPLSAFLMAAGKIEGRTQGGPCDRALSILDGLSRYDITLEQQGTGTIVQKGLAGSTTVCRVVFKPVAGQIGEVDRGRSASPNSDIDQILVTFGRVGTMDLYVPVSVQAQTQFGGASVALTEISADPARSTASR